MHDVFGSTGKYEASTLVATIGTKVDDMVGTFDDIKVVFNHDDGMSTLDESVKSLEQFFDVVEMQACGWFVENE